MKTLALTIGMALATFSLQAQQTLTIKQDATAFTWKGKKVTGEHTGNIAPAKGTFIVNKESLTGGEVVIDMRSITCTDMEGEYADKLIGHLHSDDFFSTEKHPEATLTILKAEPLKNKEGSYTHMVTGKLTIKGQTHEVKFPAFLEIKDNKLAAAGELRIDRTKYGIRYGSASFFNDLGDKAIDNEFVISFKIGAAS